MSTKSIIFALATSLSIFAAGCGDTSRGASASIVRLVLLDASPGGGSSASFTEHLDSDVITNASIFPDLGRASMDLILKDPGASGSTNVPSDLNAVTFTQYHVQFIRSDGHNVEGVDVPYAFDGGLTFTVTATKTDAVFELVHSSAKAEAPLKALATSGQIINTIARVTFYGRDMAGKNVVITGDIGVVFANFADPKS